MAALNDARNLYDSFHKLQKTLLNLRELPLAIVGVKCTSAYYRKTKPYPYNGLTVSAVHYNIVDGAARVDETGHFPPFLPSIKVLMTLQRSGKWGNDLSVVGKLKSAFYIDLSQRLKINEKWFSLPLENQLYVVVDRIVFSLEIVHHKEIELLLKIESEELPKSDSHLKWRKNASFLLRKRYIHKPLISQQLYGLMQRFSAFAETCNYVRQWLLWSYLSKQFEAMAIELLVASLFVNCSSVPTTGLAGFARFIEFLATFDFVSNPVFIDINNSLLPEAINQAKEEFVKRRPTLPPLVIITPEDTLGTIFTCLKPEAVVFLRTIKLAAVTHSRICSNALKNNINLVFELPDHDLSIYDLIIKLHDNFVSISKQKPLKKGESFGNKKCKHYNNTYLPIVDFDPLKEYVKILRNNFDSIALFFYNSYQSSSIGVIIRPTFFAPRDATVITNCHARLRKNEQLIPNIEGLIDDLKVLGGQIVHNIVLSKKLKSLLESNNMDL